MQLHANSRKFLIYITNFCDLGSHWEVISKTLLGGSLRHFISYACEVHQAVVQPCGTQTIYKAAYCLHLPMALYHITSHHITSHHITSHHITSHHITSHHITSHHITSHHITSHHITSHHITSHHSLSSATTSRIAPVKTAFETYNCIPLNTAQNTQSLAELFCLCLNGSKYAPITSPAKPTWNAWPDLVQVPGLASIHRGYTQAYMVGVW